MADAHGRGLESGGWARVTRRPHSAVASSYDQWARRTLAADTDLTTEYMREVLERSDTPEELLLGLRRGQPAAVDAGGRAAGGGAEAVGAAGGVARSALALTFPLPARQPLPQSRGTPCSGGEPESVAAEPADSAADSPTRSFRSTSQQTHKQASGPYRTMEHPCHARDRRGRLQIRGLLRAQGVEEAPVPEEGMVRRSRRESHPMGAPGRPALPLLGAGPGTRRSVLAGRHPGR